MTRSSPLRTLEQWPRTRLGVAPTPLVPADNLAAALGRPPSSTWLKLDDYTGFALGGNKVRKLETEMSADRLAGIDTIITCGGPQSNHARVTAAAAARLGLRCVLVINADDDETASGNARLHRLLTPHLIHVPTREAREPAMLQAQHEAEARGHRALIVPLGASTGHGALGYALAMVELERQMRPDAGWSEGPVRVFVAASSGGTLAGMLLGRALLGLAHVHLVGVSADDPPTVIRARVLQLAREGAGLIGLDGPIDPDGLSVTADQVGEGYGIPTAESRDAARLWARSEGVVLDPAYTSKAAAEMRAAVAAGRIPATDRVVFWHTGGHPALLA